MMLCYVYVCNFSLFLAASISFSASTPDAFVNIHNPARSPRLWLVLYRPPTPHNDGSYTLTFFTVLIAPCERTFRVIGRLRDAVAEAATAWRTEDATWNQLCVSRDQRH